MKSQRLRRPPKEPSDYRLTVNRQGARRGTRLAKLSTIGELKFVASKDKGGHT